MSAETSEKYILTAKELHLGFIKETFRAGAVIELDNARGRLVIDGRKFDDIRDLDILKRQAAKFPERAFIVPFSEEVLEEVRNGISPVEQSPKKPRPGEDMEIVQSDEDSHAVIDIRKTQVARNKAEEREEHKRIVKSGKLEIIKGDESVEERIASLKDKNDPASIAERARLKQSRATMPVVKDDSLGMGVSSKTVAMNAGQILPDRKAIEARTEDAKALADARKRQAEVKRKATVDEDSEMAEATGADLTERPVTKRDLQELRQVIGGSTATGFVTWLAMHASRMELGQNWQR